MKNKIIMMVCLCVTQNAMAEFPESLPIEVKQALSELKSRLGFTATIQEWVADVDAATVRETLQKLIRVRDSLHYRERIDTHYTNNHGLTVAYTDDVLVAAVVTKVSSSWVPANEWYRSLAAELLARKIVAIHRNKELSLSK